MKLITFIELMSAMRAYHGRFNVKYTYLHLVHSLALENIADCGPIGGVAPAYTSSAQNCRLALEPVVRSVANGVHQFLITLAGQLMGNCMLAFVAVWLVVGSIHHRLFRTLGVERQLTWSAPSSGMTLPTLSILCVPSQLSAMTAIVCPGNK